MPILLARLLNEGHGVLRIIAQVGPQRPFPEIAAAVRELETLADSTTGLTLIHHGLAPSEYSSLLDETDILLLPYQAEGYGTRISSICVEAMAAGKVIIGPREGWLGEQAEHYRGYVPVDTRVVDQMVGAILEAVDAYPVLASHASHDARQFASQSPEALVDAILNVVEGTTHHRAGGGRPFWS